MRTVKSRYPVALAVALALVAFASLGWAQDMSTARPYVMVLLDTSGSMEWRPSAFIEGENRMPRCDDRRRIWEKSRWITTTEVLTGSFQSYKCAYTERDGDEAGYYIPHVNPIYSGQSADGIIDTFSGDVEFGLMTMDSLPSPLPSRDGMWSYPMGGETLADRHAEKRIGGLDAQGILWTRLDRPDCQYFWNLGARRPWVGEEDFAGGMIRHGWVPEGAGATAWRARNNAVQEQILAVSPYWSSPIAALLGDSRYYWENDPGVIEREGDEGEGDCFFECRNRHVILITDGVPNADGRPECRFAIDGTPPTEGVCPYPQAWEEAFALYSAGVKVHVVGFSAVDTEAEVLDAEGHVVDVVDELERIGRWGWGGLEENCPTDSDGRSQCVLYADDAAELRAALAEILNAVVEDASSRTQTATINTVVTDVTGQHQYFSSMEITRDNWEGNLERLTFVCEQDEDDEWQIVREDDVYNYGDDGLDELDIPWNNFTKRHLFTVDPSQPISPSEDADGERDFIDLHDADITSNMLGIPAGPLRGARRTATLNWMHGATGSDREDARLGAIYHTTPVIVGAPTLELPLVSYNVGPHESAGEVYNGEELIGFRQLYSKRPNILYAATMDGILHAFEAEAERDDAEDEEADDNPEIWGFVPPMLLKSLYKQRDSQMYLLDGNITVRDLRLWKDSGGDDIDQWATVLVMGLRQGGGTRGYFALDVTAPYMSTTDEPSPGAAARANSIGQGATTPYGQPTLLWEISSEMTDADPIGTETLTSFSALGLTYSRPAFGTAVITDSGDTGETAIVALPGGVRPDGESIEVGCGLYIVRASDGRLIRWLTPEFANCTSDDGDPECDYDPSVHDCQIVGTPLALGSLPGDITTRIFVGDSQGRLYRADLSNSNPRNWTLDPYFSLYEDSDEGRQPMYEAPAAAMDHRGLVTLIIGTGDPDDLESRPLNRMASITEMFDMRGANTVDGHTCHMRWSQVYRRIDWGSDEFELPRRCRRADRVFPWVNWVLELDSGSTPETANLVGEIGSPRARFITGERMLGQPVVFNDIAYFTTFVPSGDEVDCCSPGHGRILGIHFVGDLDPENITFTDDVFRDPNNDDASIEVHEMDEGEIAFGVSVVRRPSCMEVSEDEIPDFAMASRAEYALVVHNNSDPDDGAGAGPEGDDAEAPETGFEELALAAPPLQCYPDSWLSILGL